MGTDRKAKDMNDAAILSALRELSGQATPRYLDSDPQSRHALYYLIGVRLSDAELRQAFLRVLKDIIRAWRMKHVDWTRGVEGEDWLLVFTPSWMLAQALLRVRGTWQPEWADSIFSKQNISRGTS